MFWAFALCRPKEALTVKISAKSSFAAFKISTWTFSWYNAMTMGLGLPDKSTMFYNRNFWGIWQRLIQNFSENNSCWRFHELGKKAGGNHELWEAWHVWSRCSKVQCLLLWSTFNNNQKVLLACTLMSYGNKIWLVQKNYNKLILYRKVNRYMFTMCWEILGSLHWAVYWQNRTVSKDWSLLQCAMSVLWYSLGYNKRYPVTKVAPISSVVLVDYDPCS